MAGSNQQSYQPTGFGEAQINPQGQPTSPLTFGGGMASGLANMGQSQGKTPEAVQFGQAFGLGFPQKAIGPSRTK